MSQLDQALAHTFPASDPIRPTSPSAAGALAKRYNLEHFSCGEYEPMIFRAPALHQTLPDILMYDLAGERRFLSQVIDSELTVVMTGSLTCPTLIENISAINDMVESYGGVNFLTLYVREAHPGEVIHRHDNLEQKLKFASLLKNRKGLKTEIYADHLDGDAHRLFGCMPHACMLLNRQRQILYRAAWMLPEHIQIVLSGLTLSPRDQPFRGLVCPKPPSLKNTWKTLREAGPTAVLDALRQAPAVARQHHSLRQYLKQHGHTGS